MPIKKLKEETSAWWDSFVSENVSLRKNGEKIFAFQRSLFNQLTKWEWIGVLVDEKVRFEYAACGRGKFLQSERKICGFKNIQIHEEWALEKCQAYREVTGCHRFFAGLFFWSAALWFVPAVCRSGYCWSGCFLYSPFLFFQLQVCRQSRIQTSPWSSL